MAQQFDLGFNIDTSGLQRAGVEAGKAAAEVGKLGAAETKLAADADKSGGAQRKFADEADRAGGAARKLATEADKAATAQHKGATEANKAASANHKLADEADKAAAALRREAAAANDNGAKKAALALRATELTGRMREQQQDIQSLSSAMRGQQGLAGGLDAAAQAGTRLLGGLGPMTIGLGLTGVAVGLVGKGIWDFSMATGQAADKITLMEGRLKSALGSVTAAKSALAQLYDQTQKTGLGFSGAADAFGRIARNNASIGMTTSEMVGMTDTVQKWGAVSGAEQGDVQGAMVQFGQAMASGRLQGDELRSIMERMPELAKQIAANFETVDGKIGISIGSLRKMGSEGELTSDKISAALLRSTDEATRQFNALDQTINQSQTRLGDSWEKLVGTMGQKFETSGLVQATNNWLASLTNGITQMMQGPTDEERLAIMDAGKARGKSVTYRGPSNVAAGSAAFNPYASNEWTQQDEDERLALAQRVAAAKREKDAQAQKEERNKALAPMMTLESNTADFAPLDQQRRRADQKADSIDKAIIDLSNRIYRGEQTADYDLDSMNETLRTLKERQGAARQAADNILSEYGKMQQASGDKREALEMGGGGAMTGIITGAMSRQRSDRAKGADAGLNAYIDVGINDTLAEAGLELDGFTRKVEEAKKNTALIGAGVAQTLAAQVDQETAAARLQKFGTMDADKINAWAAAYKDGLMGVKQALQDTEEAQKAFNAEKDATTSTRMLEVGLDPRSQQKASMDVQIEEAAKGFTGGVNDPEYIRMAAAMRSKASNDQLLQDRMAVREAQKQLDLSQRLQAIQNLTSDEKRVQTAIIQKQIDLEYAGIDASSIRYKTEVAITDQLERQRITSEKGTTQSRVTDVVESGLDRIPGLFNNMWKEVFTNGVDEGWEIFGKGMADIINDVGAQMMTELVYEPFKELIRQAMLAMANWAVAQIFGGGMQTGAGAINQVKSGASGPIALPGTRRLNATGNVYPFPFAKGGDFTNQIVDTPTLFSFARGTKLGEMGEAGPEAIMPLERGKDGRLGVSARGGGGGDVAVNIYDQRSGGDKVEVQERRGTDGKRQIAVMIRDAQRNNIRGGNMDREMMSSYGAQRSLTKL